MDRRTLLSAAAAALALPGPPPRAAGAVVAPARAARRIEVMAHRGSSALRPEHTLAAYAKAVMDGADFIEPDLVCTRDGVLVVRHEDEIGATTDIAQRPEFADRRTTRTIDGQSETGWFASNLSLAELKTLRARERIPQVRPDSAIYDGRFQVLTFDEVIDFAAALSATLGRDIGLIPELKHSTFFASIGLPLEERFLQAIAAHEYTRRAPLVVQSFEVANLKWLRERMGRPANLRLMQLTGDPRVVPADIAAGGGNARYADITSAVGLRELARYADIVAPPIPVLIPWDADGRLQGPASSIIRDAHAAGLQVGTWTFRPENQFMAADFRNAAGANARNVAGSVAEIQNLIEAGIDGFFTDDPAVGRLAVGQTAA
jgi:glycerophosphoryl diester phosphodiesterase